jgi:hypothetical protein
MDVNGQVRVQPLTFVPVVSSDKALIHILRIHVVSVIGKFSMYFIPQCSEVLLS